MTEIADDEISQDIYKSTETKSDNKFNFNTHIDSTNVDQTMESADFANNWGKYFKAITYNKAS